MIKCLNKIFCKCKEITQNSFKNCIKWYFNPSTEFIIRKTNRIINLNSNNPNKVMALGRNINPLNMNKKLTTTQSTGWQKRY